MTTKEISYIKRFNCWGSHEGKGLLIFLSEQELERIKKLNEPMRQALGDDTVSSLLTKLLERIRTVNKPNPEYPDEIYSTIIYKEEYPMAAQLMLLLGQALD